MKSIGSLGNHVRRLRQQRQWSLAELSKASGIASSTLSKVENDALSLNFDRLQSVAKGFSMTLSEFLSPIDADNPGRFAGRVDWARKGEARIEKTNSYDYYYLCTHLREKKMVPIRSRIKARTLEEFGDLLRHSGEEFIYVVQGRVEVHLELYEPQTLEVGEAVYIDSQQGHAYLDVANGEETWIISVNAS